MDLNILSLSLSSYIRNYTLRGFLFEVDSWKIHQWSSISQQALYVSVQRDKKYTEKSVGHLCKHV